MLKGAKSKILNQKNIILRTDCLVRSKHSNEGYKLQPFGQTSSKRVYHQPQSVIYPATKQLPLPLNIEDLASSVKLKFSPQRNRDISSSYISSSTTSFTDVKSDYRLPVDNRIECYDCSGTINLSSAMQTNVPFPFVSRGKPIHLNMPGGQWRQNEKYVSEDLNNVHHTNTREVYSKSGSSCWLGNKTGAKNFYFSIPNTDMNLFSNSSCTSFTSFNMCHFRNFYTAGVATNFEKGSGEVKVEPKKVHYVTRLKTAVKDYGPVIVVFHVSLSLVSLGVCYLLISSGLDLSSLLKGFGLSDGAGAASTAAGFVVAYGVHKSLAPVRVGVTLTVAPFIVKKLRKMGILKSPQPKA